MERSISEKDQLIKRTDNFINGLSINELVVINKFIVERIKHLQKATALNEMVKYRIGEIVTFNNGEKFVTGRIIKFNQKTISLITDQNVQWNVSPRLLMKKAN